MTTKKKTSPLPPLFLASHTQKTPTRIALLHLDELESSRDALRRAVELFEEEQQQQDGAAAGKGDGSSRGGSGGGSGGSASARKWLRKAEEALAAEEGASVAPAVAVSEENAKEGAAARASASASATAAAPAARPEAAAAEAPPPPPPPPPPRFRHQWFQTGDAVEVGVLAKGLRKEAVRVQIEARRLLVVIDESSSSSSSSSSSLAASFSSPSPFTLDLALAGEVVPEKCRHAVLSTKVEIRLHKAVPGWAWPGLEEEKTAETKESERKAAAAAPPPLPLAPAPAAAVAAADKSSSSKGGGPSYPSSNPKRTDWDELDRKLEREEEQEEAEAPSEGEEALLKLFRSVYSGGDDDVRRAMSKSFVESKGEVLSTSWNDVSVGKLPGEEECFHEGCRGEGESCGHKHRGGGEDGATDEEEEKKKRERELRF